MENTEFQQVVSLGVPVTFQGQAVKLEEFFDTIKNVIREIEKLEIIKKKLFCENGYRSLAADVYFNNCSSLPAQFESYDEGARLMYSVLNIACESKGILQAMLSTIENKHFVNTPAFKERSANMLQHLAGISKFISISFEELEICNIEKLEQIYPENMNRALSTVRNEPKLVEA